MGWGEVRCDMSRLFNAATLCRQSRKNIKIQCIKIVGEIFLKPMYLVH